MKRARKPWKYYILMYVLIMIFTVGYTIFMLLRGNLETQDIWYMLFVPPLFVGFLFLFDQLKDWLFKKKKPLDGKVVFLEEVSIRMRSSKEFSVEDFRLLQLSSRFQDTLEQAYHKIEINELNEEYLQRLEKRFEKRSLEAKAVQYVILCLKEKIAN